MRFRTFGGFCKGLQDSVTWCLGLVWRWFPLGVWDFVFGLVFCAFVLS